jgi:hypothetical protein
MTECWSEGELRAYLDGELPAAAHLKECAECARALEELRGRALWVEEMMGTLAEPEVAPRRVRRRWEWVAAAAALAAGIGIGVAVRKQKAPEPVASVRTPVVVSEPATAGLRPVDGMASRPQVSNLPQKRRANRHPTTEGEFVALDDEPFDSGVVLRMALGPAEVPADVLVGPDGRARAIRLVNYK